MLNKSSLLKFESNREIIKQLEQENAAIKVEILSLAGSNGVLSIEGLTVKVTSYEQEYFKIKEASKVLDKRQLTPFITVATINRISIK